MRMNKMFILWLTSLGLLMSCGKPNDPESLLPADVSGGYKIYNRYSTTASAQDVVKKDSLVYVAQGEGGLMIINVKNPAYPETVSITTKNVRGYSARITMKDTVVYLAAGTFGVTVLDVFNPYNPLVSVSNLNMKPARNLHIMGNYMFTAISEQGIIISDISFPLQPDIRGTTYTSGYAYGVTTTADSAYMMAACGEMGLSIYDISDFQEGFGVYPLVGWCDTPGYAEAVVLDEARSIAFLACGNSGLQIINYADSSNIYITGSFYNSGYAKSLIYKDNKIYLAARRGGLQIINVSNVQNPTLIGKVTTDGALGLFLDEPYIYVADELQGLIIISIP